MPMPKLSAALVIAGLMCLTACGASSSVTDAPGGPTRSTMPSAAPTSAAASTPAGAVADVASPYTAPDEPPEGPGPLVIRPSGDAADRLGRVSGGDLVDSGGFHQSAFRDDDPLQADPRKISFTTPSGNIGCSGSRDYLVCALAEGSVPLPPEPPPAAATVLISPLRSAFIETDVGPVSVTSSIRARTSNTSAPAPM